MNSFIVEFELRGLYSLAWFSEKGMVSNSSEYSFVVRAIQPIARPKLFEFNTEPSSTATEGEMHAFVIS